MLKFVFIVLCTVLTYDVTGGQKVWETPDAWGRIQSEGHLPIQPSTSLTEHPSKQSCAENLDHIRLYYVKLLKFLFNSGQMSLDKSSSYYSRSLNFRLTESQLHILQNSKDPRDWDHVATEILSNPVPAECQCQNNAIARMIAFIQDCWQMILDSSDLRLASMLVAGILIILYLKRKYKYGIVPIILWGCGMWGYYKSYKDCIREMEAEELVGALFDAKNPCDELKPSLYGRFFFGQEYYKHQCIKHLKNQNKPNSCDPGHVFMRFFNEVFFNQVFLIVEKSADVLQKSTTKFAFPFNYMAIIVVGLFLFHFMKFCIKYLFMSITHAWDNPRVPRRMDNASDQLTGENLRLLLQRINTPAQPESERNLPDAEKAKIKQKSNLEAQRKAKKKSLLAVQTNTKYKSLVESNSISFLRRGSF